MKFDHEFTGKEALEKMVNNQKRKKVTLVWNGEDVAKAMASMFHSGGDIVKYIDMPLANYSTLPYDKVVKDGKTIGVSTYTGYTFNERAMISLAMVDVAYCRARRTSHAGVGRRRRRLYQADRRTPQASRNPRHRSSRALRRSCPHRLPTQITP